MVKSVKILGYIVLFITIMVLGFIEHIRPVPNLISNKKSTESNTKLTLPQHEKEVKGFLSKLVDEWYASDRSTKNECSSKVCLDQFRLNVHPSGKSIVRHNRLTASISDEDLEALKVIMEDGWQDREEVCNGVMFGLMERFSIEVHFIYYTNENSIFLRHNVGQQECVELFELVGRKG